jgi:hypothetical protein
MIRRVTGLLLLVVAVTGLAFGGADAGRSPGTITSRPDTSSPDAWGYTWVRHNEPGGRPFNWVDITTRGTLVTGLGDDNFLGPFPIQFQFPYYWYTVSNFWIGSNGYINFSSPANFASPFAQLPNTGGTVPKDLLAICVGDLDFTVAASNPRCYYWSNGVDSLVVSFINVTEWQPTANPNARHTFQVILNKADSSITYQYGLQQGRYNQPNNQTLCIGWQNQTGQVGLSYTFSAAPPHALHPDSGFTIKIKRTVNTGLSVTDAGTIGGLNAGNLAKVVRTGVADTIRAVVKNFGTVALSNVQVRYAITRALQPSSFDTVIIPSMAVGQEMTVTFPRLFTPAVAGSYNALFATTVAGDIGPGNNNKTAEILSNPMTLNQSNRIQFENGTVSGNINWTGGGGMGVAVDLPLYPVQVESVFASISTAASITIEILSGASGSPGTVLATRTLSGAVGFNGVDFRSDNVIINSGRFFIGGRGTTGWNYETTPPISFRSWEFTNGWAPYRSGDLQDVLIRCTVRPITSDVGEPGIPTEFSLSQNYPNPFNPATNIHYALSRPSRVSVRVFDQLGQHVATLNDEVQGVGTHDVVWYGKNSAGQSVASGVYFYKLEAQPTDGGPMFTSFRKMLLVK